MRPDRIKHLFMDLQKCVKSHQAPVDGGLVRDDDHTDVVFLQEF